MKKILIVDDDDLVRNLIGDVVKSVFAGAEVICARDGVDGLQKFNEHMPCLIISDIRMPLMTGTELFSRIREKSQVPVVLMSGICSAEELAIATKANSFVEKPFNMKKFCFVLSLMKEQSLCN